MQYILLSMTAALLAAYSRLTAARLAPARVVASKGRRKA
jgi:hypothetical protein